MNKLSVTERARVLACLMEGKSIRATARMTGAAKNTVVKLLAEVGAACAGYQDEALQNLPCKRLQSHEIWSFAYAPTKNIPTARGAPESAEDAWTWAAICADTKLVPCWMIGPRNGGVAYDFMQEVAGRLASRVRLTRDGLKTYLESVEGDFRANIDYAHLSKLYGDAPNDGPERKHNPNVYLGADPRMTAGDPDMTHVDTSYVERQTLRMRLNMRRYTRLTDGSSMKLEKLGRAIALHFMYYNFGRIHQSLRVTPAMAAGVSDHVWSLQEIGALADGGSN